MAQQIVEMSADQAKLFQALDKLIAKERDHERQLAGVGDAGASAGADIEKALERIGKANEKDIGRLLRDLGKVGPEGKVAAEALKKNFQEAGKFGQRNFDQIVESIRRIDPEAAKAAQEARAAMQKADKESEFRNTIDSLSQLGSTGGQVAAVLKQRLVEAGKLSEESIDDVIAKIRQIDPAAADAAAAMYKQLDGSAKKSEASWVTFGKSAAAQVTAVAGAYLGVQEGIQAVNEYLRQQQQLLDDALDKQLELGKAQQDAAKNLAGLSVVQRYELLQESVPEIARDTGFSDIAEITQALGAVASAGETDPKKIANAVRQAARIERLTPDNLDSTAAAASAVQRQAGLGDIREAIALVETTGTQARITDPGQLLANLPGAVGNAVNTVPQQNPQTAARQAAALFSQITQFGNDDRGESSKTFTQDLTGRLNEFFTGLEDERVRVRSQVELIDRKIAKGSDTELDRQNRTRALEFLSAAEGVSDSGTLFGRIEQLQSSPALARQFIGSGFGEQRFQAALTGLADPNSSISRALRSSFDTIQADTAFFEREAGQLAASTPQLALGSAAQGFKAAVASGEGFDNEGAALAQIRRLASEAAVQGNAGGLTGFVQGVVDDTGIGRGRLSGGTAIEEAVAGIKFLNRKIAELARDGISKSEQRRVANLRAGIQAIERTIVDVVNSGGQLDLSGAQGAVSDARSGAGVTLLPGASVDDDFLRENAAANQTLERIAALLEQQLAASEETAGNTRPEPTNYGDVQRGRQQ